MTHSDTFFHSLFDIKNGYISTLGFTKKSTKIRQSTFEGSAIQFSLMPKMVKVVHGIVPLFIVWDKIPYKITKMLISPIYIIYKFWGVEFSFLLSAGQASGVFFLPSASCVDAAKPKPSPSIPFMCQPFGVEAPQLRFYFAYYFGRRPALLFLGYLKDVCFDNIMFWGPSAT